MVDYLDSTRIVNGITGQISPWEFPWGTDNGTSSTDGYAIVQPFLSYKNRLTDKLTMTAGLTALYSNINDSIFSPIEPRLGSIMMLTSTISFLQGQAIIAKCRVLICITTEARKRRLRPLQTVSMERNTTKAWV